MTTPATLSNLVVMGKNGHEYEFDYMNDKVYITKYKQQMATLLVIGALVLIVVFFYDWFKDVIRTFSGYKDIWNGKSSGAAKVMGFTKGNMTRTMIMIGLALAMWFLYKMMERSKRLIDVKDVPKDVMQAAGADVILKLDALKK